MAGKKRVRDLAAEAAAVAPGRKAFGPEAMARVVEALRGGATVKAAALAAGFSEGTVHEWRRRAPHFDAACRAALDARGPMLVVEGAGGRDWQLRRPRRNAFSRRRKAIYLEHFAATCDARAAAAAAGVSKSTVCNHRMNDPAFAEGCRLALAEGYANLEGEAVRQRLAAMAAIDFDPGKEPPPPAGDGDAGAEFERTMLLLREYKKTAAGLPRGGRPPERWSFDDAMEALEKQLKAFGVRVREEDLGPADDE